MLLVLLRTLSLSCYLVGCGGGLFVFASVWEASCLPEAIQPHLIADWTGFIIEVI